MAFATVPRGALVVTRGAVRHYRSSDIAERWFCGDCGTQLAIDADYQPDTLDVAIATLDEPARVKPGFHLFTAERVAWFDTADDAPRFAGFRPETVGHPSPATASPRREP